MNHAATSTHRPAHAGGRDSAGAGGPRPAFTLVELLVVIAIIGVLVSLTLPALSSARTAAQTTACSVNQRSIGQAFTMYADANRELSPHWSAWHTFGGDGTGDDTPGPGWVELIASHLESLECMRDPGVKFKEVPFAYFLQSRFSRYLNYRNLGPAAAANEGMFSSYSVNMVALNSQFIVLGDAANKTLLSAPYGDSPKAPNCDPDDARWDGLFAPDSLKPHKGPVNVLFLDGHVDRFKKYEPGRMTWHGSQQASWDQLDPVTALSAP
ncbi:MAG TPA: type II secretion system protein [Phycisphaerales bacterium]|nr:type II secretion system protein [Phycisphaerales bacterium]